MFYFLPLGIRQATGSCLCKENVAGDQCDTCLQGYFNFSSENPLGCQECACNPNATNILPGTNLTECDVNNGQCKCKTNFVQGNSCDTCVDSMFNLGRYRLSFIFLILFNLKDTLNKNTCSKYLLSQV